MCRVGRLMVVYGVEFSCETDAVSRFKDAVSRQVEVERHICRLVVVYSVEFSCETDVVSRFKGAVSRVRG